MGIGHLKARIDKLIEERTREAARADAAPAGIVWLPRNGREVSAEVSAAPSGRSAVRFFDIERRQAALAAGADDSAALEAAEVHLEAEHAERR